MTLNNEIRYALDYHEATKHSEASLLSSRHYLDFDIKPIPFKIYLELPSFSLPTSFPTPEVNALSCISGTSIKKLKDHAETLTRSTRRNTNITNTNHNIAGLDVSNLAEILFFSAGITREISYTHGRYYMRAASATGALYPIELYVVCDDVSPDLAAGVYHFSPADFSLTRIRSGRYMKYLATTASHNQDVANSAIALIFSSMAWRNAWKYQARSYRHWFWDSGVIAANLLATTYAMGLPTRLIMGFLDDDIGQLLALEEQREAPIAIAAIGEENHKVNTTISNQQVPVEDRISPVSIPRIRPLSERGEIIYPEIWNLNDASKLTTKQEIEEWISNACRHQAKLSISSHDSGRKGANDENSLIIRPEDCEANLKASRSLKETILWRGSSRNFAKTSISISSLKSILYSSTRGVPLDIFTTEENSLTGIYFIANAIDGLSPGAYFYNRSASTDIGNNSIERVKHLVSSRNISGYLCLGQTLFSDASVVFFLMADLQSVLEVLGNRGYRSAQFEAGIIAGKIYLSAYALGIGASGSTFFDDAVTEFFSPHAAKKSTMIAIGVGVPAYNARPGKILPTTLNREQLLTKDFT
jgi:SagB-type dehydrogenase family enzyme